MKRRLFIIGSTLLVCFSQIYAHPGVGIVQDSRGNIFYTDLIHVWKISPAGHKQIAVRNVHTHELALDQQDNLYGEDLQYEGEALNRWHHRIWKRSANGRVIDLIGQRRGFRTDFGFVWDKQGRQYWIDQETHPNRIRRKEPDGRISTITPSVALASHLNWLAVAADGRTLYISSSQKLYQIQETGESQLLLQQAGQTNWMGMWPDRTGQILIANFGERSVQAVTLQGGLTTIARLQAPWSPSGLLRDLNDNLWILEYSTTNQARVRRIDKQGHERVF